MEDTKAIIANVPTAPLDTAVSTSTSTSCTPDYPAQDAATPTSLAASRTNESVLLGSSMTSATADAVATSTNTEPAGVPVSTSPDSGDFVRLPHRVFHQ